MVRTFTLSHGPDQMILEDISLPTPVTEQATLEYDISYKYGDLSVVVKKIHIIKARAVDETDYRTVKKINTIILSYTKTFNLIYLLTAYADQPPKYKNLLNLDPYY